MRNKKNISRYRIDTLHLSCLVERGFIESCAAYCEKRELGFEQETRGYKTILDCGYFRTEVTKVSGSEYEQAIIQVHSVLCNKYGLSIIKNMVKIESILEISINRVDVCVDLINENFKLVKGIIRKKPSKATVRSELVEKDKTIETVYFKSNSFVVRIYDKYIEQKNKTNKLLPDIPEDWKRFEIEFKKDFLARYNVRNTDNLNLSELRENISSLIVTLKENYSFNPKYDKIIKRMITGGNKLYTYKPEYDHKTTHKNALRFSRIAEYLVARNPEKYRKIINSPELQKAISENYHNNKRLKALN